MTVPLIDGPAIAATLGIKPDRLRKWLERGLVQARGRDSRGRTVFDLDEVIGVSQRLNEGRGRTVTPDNSSTSAPRSK